ncbi:MAG: hypothetical protein AAFN70_20690, partial [Planctomycetota bacterium]
WLAPDPDQPERPPIVSRAMGLWGMLFISATPTLFIYFWQMWHVPHYDFLPWLLIAIPLLVYLRWASQSSSRPAAASCAGRSMGAGAESVTNRVLGIAV